MSQNLLIVLKAGSAHTCRRSAQVVFGRKGGAGCCADPMVQHDLSPFNLLE